MAALGDALSNRVEGLKSHIEKQAQTINDLRSIMFKAATELRVADAERFRSLIETLELPAGNGCNGQGCAYAFALHDRVNELERQVYEQETLIYLLSGQLGVDPANPSEQDASGAYPDCCPRV